MIFKLILSFISVVLGFAAFLTFLFFQNYQASVWAFLTGLTACVLFQLHLLKYRNKIVEYYTPYDLWSIAWIGFSMFAIGISGVIYNIIIYTVLQIPIVPVKDSVIISAIWCILTLKTGALLFWYARKYAHFASGYREQLLEAPAQNQEST